MQIFFMILFVTGIVAADQLTKFLPLGTFSPDRLLVSSFPVSQAVPGLFSFDFETNEGGAWSVFPGAIWLFVLIFAVFTVLLLWNHRRKYILLKPVEQWCLAAVYGGGLGNILDRIRLGFVVDMIRLDFISFPIFNVADCFISCGCVLLIVHLLFFNKEAWKDGKK